MSANSRLARWPPAVALVLGWGCVGRVESAVSGAGVPRATTPPAPASDLTPGAPAGPVACKVGALRAPLRRLTRFEFDNTVRDLLGDDTAPGAALPSDELSNGFGNDADALSVSSLLVEQYGAVAEAIAARATRPDVLATLVPCRKRAVEADCARDFVAGFAARAYRRAVTSEEIAELMTLEGDVRASGTLASAIAAVIEAVLQSPEFLYRVELGVADPAHPGARRPSGEEMATRLSYLLWGTMPDEGLRAAAQAGQLDSAAGVVAQAGQMLEDPRARPVVRFFFDSLLPISGLAGLERDPTLYPTYSGAIGGLMREETQRLIAAELLDGSGDWAAVLGAPYTFVNGPLAGFYGIGGVTGDAFQKVSVDGIHRLGLLTEGGLMVGTTPSNSTNPVLRGSFIVRKLLCKSIPLPSGDLLAKVKPPDPYSGKTARERYTAHRADPVCAGCHQQMDPIGLAFENYDPVGLWRDQENGVTIDASGKVPGTGDQVSGPIEMVKKLAAGEDAQACLAAHWMDFAYGQAAASRDACLQQQVVDAFARAGHDVRKLLLALTQTDAFLSLPAGAP
jgi:hypothetical protein